MSADLLLGIPSKIKSLLDRLPVSRANKIDNIDTTVSSRAPASTALSSNIWTNARAAFLNANITSRASQASLNATDNKVDSIKNNADVKASSRLSTVFGVRKVQTGFITATNFSSGTGEDLNYFNITISPVSAANKCEVYFQLAYIFGSNSHLPTARLTSTTNLRISITYPTSSLALRWYVMELQ